MRQFTKYPSNYVDAASETSGAAMRKKKREIEERGRAGSELLATDGDWELWTPKDWYGAMYICKLYGGEKPRWSTCVATEPRYFDQYNSYGPLYIFVNKSTGEKYQSHPATKSWFYDIYDHNKGKEAFDKFICEHPAFAEFFDVECDDDVNACGDIDACGDINCSTDPSDQDYIQAAFAPDFAAGDTADRLVSDGEWELWTPNTFEGSQFLARLYGGRDANWATAYDKHYFDSYTAQGPLYVIVNKNTGEKYQVQPETGSYFDADDVSIGRAGFNQLCCEHPAIGEFFGVSCGDVIDATTDIMADRVKSKFDPIRDLLGEDEWGYIQEYIMDVDDRPSLDAILHDVDAWDQYCDWKMQKYHKKPAISASTRLKAWQYLR